MTTSWNPYRGFRFPREVIEHAVWLAPPILPQGGAPPRFLGAGRYRRGEAQWQFPERDVASDYG
jgi:hypothetical protein